MPNLIFKQLTVASDTQSAANQFQFHPRFNLITANDNSVGKSTIAKLLQWTLGAEPILDTTWKNFDVRSLVEFEINNIPYKVGRAGDRISLHVPNEGWKTFPKITGEYSKAFSEIVGFHALLANRDDSTLLENPPPAYYLLPFYIDQKKGWNQSWSGFSNLEQYSSWYKSIINYHTGYLSEEHFVFEKEKAKNNFEKKEPERENNFIRESIGFLKEYTPKTEVIVNLSEDDFNNLSKELSTDIFKLQEEQEKILSEIADLSSNRIFQINQKKMIEQSIIELEKDYLFSVENIDNGLITCPICGTDYQNTAPNRALILADQADAKNQSAFIDGKISSIDKKLSKIHEKLQLNKNKLDDLQKKYIPFGEENSSEDKLIGSLIDSIASRSIQKKANITVEKNIKIIDELKTKNKALTKNQKNLLSKEELEEKNTFFKSKLQEYIDVLKANQVNLAEVERPTDYKKLESNGGAAESTRGILAYYMTILHQILREKNEVFSSIIIDTPNQQEQTDFNYELILDFIINQSPSTAQVIVCAMEKPEIEKYKKLSNVIKLTDEKILLKSKFKQLRPFLNF